MFGLWFLKLISGECHLPRWFIGRCSNFSNCQTFLSDKIAKQGYSGVKSLCQEVKVIFHVWKNWQVLEDLVFAEVKLWCLMTKPERFRWVSDCGIFHKQVGVGLLFTPGTIPSISSCRFRQRYTPSHGTWYPVPKLYFGEQCFITIPRLWFDYALISDYLLCRSFENCLKYRRIKYCGVSFDVRKRTTYLGLSRLTHRHWEGDSDQFKKFAE